MTKLIDLHMSDSPTRHAFMILFQDTCNRYDTLSGWALTNDLKKTLLQKAISHDTALTNSWNTVRRAVGGSSATPPSYSDFYTFLVTQSKTHDLATPFKRSTRHANQSIIDTLDHGSNDNDNDDDSIINDFIANISADDRQEARNLLCSHPYTTWTCIGYFPSICSCT
jgi:hypothetical protein